MSKSITLQDVFDTACGFFGLSPEAMYSRRRNKEIAEAFCAITDLLRNVYQADFVLEMPTLLFRDHATIIRSLNVSDKRKKEDNEYRAHLQMLEKYVAQKLGGHGLCLLDSEFLTQDRTYVFDNFSPCGADREAYDAAVNMAEGRQVGQPALMLTGNPGSGKTHLLRAIEASCQSNRALADVRCTTWNNLRAATIGADNASRSVRQNWQAVRDDFQTTDILLVDDLPDARDRAAASEGERWALTVERANALLQKREKAGKRTVLAGRAFEVTHLGDYFKKHAFRRICMNITDADFLPVLSACLNAHGLWAEKDAEAAIHEVLLPVLGEAFQAGNGHSIEILCKALARWQKKLARLYRNPHRLDVETVRQAADFYGEQAPLALHNVFAGPD